MPTTREEAMRLVEMAKDVRDYAFAAANLATKLAADYVALLDANRWIPVGERLPEIGTEVPAWVDHDGGYADLRIYTPDGGEWDGVTYWKLVDLSPPEPEKQ